VSGVKVVFRGGVKLRLGAAEMLARLGAGYAGQMSGEGARGRIGVLALFMGVHAERESGRFGALPEVRMQVRRRCLPRKKRRPVRDESKRGHEQATSCQQEGTTQHDNASRGPHDSALRRWQHSSWVLGAGPAPFSGPHLYAWRRA
jgi:hypothetical protein